MPMAMARGRGRGHARSASATMCLRSPLVEEFEAQLTAHVRELAKSPSPLFTLDWSARALSVCAVSNTQALQLLPRAAKAPRVEELLEDTVTVLEACESLRHALCHVREYAAAAAAVASALARRPLSSGLCPTPSPAHMARASAALAALGGAAAAPRAKLRKTQSSLRRTAERLGSSSRWKVKARARDMDADSDALDMIDAAMCATAFLCGVLAAGLCAKGYLPGAPAGLAAWAVALQEVNQRVRQEVLGRCSSAHGVAPLVGASGERLCAALERCVSCKSSASAAEIADAAVALRSSMCALEQALPAVEKQVDELFKVLVCSRMALLDALTYS